VRLNGWKFVPIISNYRPNQPSWEPIEGCETGVCSVNCVNGIYDFEIVLWVADLKPGNHIVTRHTQAVIRRRGGEGSRADMAEYGDSGGVWV